ncbi:MAG: aspartate kinase [Acidimicrobiia bacterium]|nr:MAG: aspartate kinase [Acidimicrobiia bacterium]
MVWLIVAYTYTPAAMALVVHKYGGTSVADAERIRNVARRIVEVYREGNGVVAVVSAMGERTDELLALAKDVSGHSHPRELDMLLTAGERVTMALVAMAIEDLGVQATSFTGSQAGILTTGRHGQAEIVEIRADRVREGLDQGKVVIVAGFQGVDPDSKDVTTLGRGGSDATAVALAAALGAERCEIFTDVDGVFTADPRVVTNAVKLEDVTFEEMLELASAGAGVLMPRSVEFGRRFSIPIHVRSSFHDGVGTWIKEETMEQAVVRGIAHDTDEAKVTVYRVPDTPGVAASLFELLATAGVYVDMIVQNVSHDDLADISFTVPLAAIDIARERAEIVAREVNAGGVSIDDGIAKVSVIGIGMKTESGIAARMFRLLSDQGINIQMISTSPIRISCVISGDRVHEAVRALHAGLGLDDEGT